MNIKLLLRALLFGLLGVLLLYVWKNVLKNETISEPVINQTTILKEIVSLGKLELIKYNFKDIVEYEKEATEYHVINKFLPNAKAVLIVMGEATGCIDLTKISKSDITVKSDTLIIYLPDPELCEYKINHEKSKVYDVSNGYFLEQGKMVDEAYKAAEKQIKNSALEMGILNGTNSNAEKILKPLLEKISSKKVVLKQKISHKIEEIKK